MKFNVGDLVKIIDPINHGYYSYRTTRGRTGVVVGFAKNGTKIGVRISGLRNPYSPNGTFWFERDEIALHAMASSGYSADGHTYKSHRLVPDIRNAYFNDPLTCVIWSDGTKTFVKNADGDSNYDPEKALAMAIAKKALGNKYSYYKEFNKWLPDTKSVPKKGNENTSKGIASALNNAIENASKNLGSFWEGAVKSILDTSPIESVLCPVCEQPIDDCQCCSHDDHHLSRYGLKKAEVVRQHLYLFSPEQQKHIIALEALMPISYRSRTKSIFLERLKSNKKSDSECPICGWEIKDCFCKQDISPHSTITDDFSDTFADYENHYLNRALVAVDHLYLFTPKQQEHIINLERQWDLVYSDHEQQEILNHLKSIYSKEG